MKKSIKIPLIILAGLIGSYLLLIAIGPYIILALHPLKLKADLNNPIINAHYSGWHKVTLDEHLQIKLPKDWTLEYGDRIVIRDGDGQTVALGARFTSKEEGDPQSSRFYQLLSDCCNQKVSQHTPENFGAGYFNNNASALWLRVDEGKKITGVRLEYSEIVQGENPYLYQYYYWFCFLGTDGGYCDEAEAIAWSMKDD